MRKLVFGLLLALMAWPALADEIVAAKGEVLTGDTMLVDDDATGRQWTMHLWGIDAPPVTSNAGQVSHFALRIAIKNRKFGCKQKERFRDMIMAVCAVVDKDGSLRDLSELQLKWGRATAWPRKDLDQKYRDAEAEAKRLKRGIWAKTGQNRPTP